MTSRTRLPAAALRLGILAWCCGASGAAALHAGRHDPAPAWPLCGRIAEAPPEGWDAAQGCPRERWGDASFSDRPISSTFGPRRLVSERYRYDFHRGLDLATPEGTPVFAIADGVVRIAGPHPTYRDPAIELRHVRPGHRSCEDGGGCWFSEYLHVSDWAVAVGERVSKGQRIGATGRSSSGFAHLHFEIRDAPPEDPWSGWQRDAIHPLHVLPYRDSGDSGRDGRVEIEDVRREDGHLRVRVAIAQPPSALDLKRVRVRVFDAGQAGDEPVEVPQPGSEPDARGYHVRPPWFDVDEWNREYTHKDSPGVPWSSFGPEGARACPFAQAHGPAYDPNVHLDSASPGDHRRGRLNGVELAPEHFNADSSELVQRFTFRRLVAPDGPARVVVEVETVDGRVTRASAADPAP